jgi:hypothetical protein
MTIETLVSNIDIEQMKIFAGGIIAGVVPTLLYIRSRYTNEELKEIAMSIHAARQEASDGGSAMTNEEALDIIDDIIVAYVE